MKWFELSLSHYDIWMKRQELTVQIGESKDGPFIYAYNLYNEICLLKQLTKDQFDNYFKIMFKIKVGKWESKFERYYKWMEEDGTDWQTVMTSDDHFRQSGYSFGHSRLPEEGKWNHLIRTIDNLIPEAEVYKHFNHFAIRQHNTERHERLNENKTAAVFIGIQGSGKSTFYEEFLPDYIHVNLDELHTRNMENKTIQFCFENLRSFAVDNTNPTKEDRQRYIPLAKENGYKVVGYYFESKIADCIERNNHRQGKAKVPEKAIAATYNKLELPSYDEGFDKLYYVSIRDGEFSIKEWKEDEV